MLRRLALTLTALAALAGSAAAQSTCPNIATGAILTAAQWNFCFQQKNDTIGYVPVNKAGDVMLGKLVTATSTPTASGFNLPQGTAPTSPNDGDVWATISGLFARINGVTVGPITGSGPPATKTGDYVVSLTDGSLIFNGSATITLTLPAAASYPGRTLLLKNIAAFTVVSDSSNVVPQAGGAAGTAILAATAGKWATLQSDGANWQIMASN